MIAISVKNNSIRIKTGIVTFDVLVIQNDQGRLIMKVPKNVFIYDKSDYEELARLVIKTYLTSMKERTTIDTKSSEIKQVNTKD